MSVFDNRRLGNETFKLDIDRMRRGWYTDKYFTNIMIMLTELAKQGYTYKGTSGRLSKEIETANVPCGDIEVEMQWFTRRAGDTLVVGLDKALTMLQHCTGYWEGDEFINTADKLQVWAIQDGDKVHYDGSPLHIQPVMRVRGRYRDFAILETPSLGVLTRASRVATNVYQTLIAANGKPILFFPARFDLHEVQAADGYAYSLAVQRYNLDFSGSIASFVSTDAQGDWWGGMGGGTVAHSAIASFLGDTPEAMLTFAAVLPPSIPRIALVDFNNDCVTDALAVCEAMFNRYRKLLEKKQYEEAERYHLYGVRLDTSGSQRDISVPPLGNPELDLGVNPRLVFAVRQALDTGWQNWSLPLQWRKQACEFCQAVKIVVSGGFTPEKISRFEKLAVPADIYAVGSSLFDNHAATVTDFTADVVRVKVNGVWQDMAKVGRRPCENKNMERIW